MDAWSRFGDLQMTSAIVKQMEQSGLEPTSRACLSLVIALANSMSAENLAESVP